MRAFKFFAAPFTPMNADGSLNLARIEQQARMLLGNGVSGVFVCGTTGEFASLGVDERMQVAERWQNVAGSSLEVMVHVGHTCLADCRTLAGHARKIGAQAIAATAPFYYKPGIPELTECLGQIAAAAPGLPLYYYHLPALSNVNLNVAELLPAARRAVPSLEGAKFSGENLFDFALCLNLQQRRFKMFFGRDEVLLSAVVLGCENGVGGTYNFSAPLYKRLVNAHARGDLEAARELQGLSQQIVALLRKYGGIPAAKAIMGMLGLDCGPVRLPLATTPPERLAQFRAELEQIGFFAPEVACAKD